MTPIPFTEFSTSCHIVQLILIKFLAHHHLLFFVSTFDGQFPYIIVNLDMKDTPSFLFHIIRI